MFKWLQKIIFLCIANTIGAAPLPSNTQSLPEINHLLQAIEREYDLKIGVYARDTNNGRIIAYHAKDRFPFQSTFKFIGVAALLANKQSLLENKILVKPEDLLPWHPVSGRYVNHTVRLKILAEGAISYSDNTAINLIIHELGGLKAINDFAHSLGNSSFRLEHYEANLNSNPNEKADTATPEDMALSMQKIMLGNVLSKANKALLLEWMRNNTTGYNRIRSGVPLGFSVADKTGSGSFGIANDIGIAWSPACKPIVLALFTVSNKAYAKANDAAVAQITKTLFREFAPRHTCYLATKLR